MAKTNTATARIEFRRIYIPKDARCVLEHTNGSALYAYEGLGKSGQYFGAVAFWGTSARPMFNYIYRTPEARDRRVWEFKQSVEAHVAYKAERNAKKAAAVNTLKAGDILYTSWGYDQTNVDFFVVTRTVGKTRVYVRKIAADYEGTGFMQGKRWPAMPIQMIGEETMHISRSDSITIDGHHASLEQGRDHHTSSYA